MLSEAERPVIVAGGGVLCADNTDKLVTFASGLQIPVVFTRLSNGVIPFSNSCSMGMGGIYGTFSANYALRNADLIIALGSRLAPGLVGEDKELVAPDVKVFMISVDSSELLRPNFDSQYGLSILLEDFFSHVMSRLHEIDIHWMGWMVDCTKRKNPMPEPVGDPIDLYSFIGAIDRHAKSNHVITVDAGTSYYVCGQVLKFETGYCEVSSASYASMGLSIPLAIGASLSSTSVQVLAITGDGSIETNIQELHTVSIYGLDIKIFVINNGGYASIRNSQDKHCEGRYFNSDQFGDGELLNFQDVATAFKMPYILLDSYSKIDEVLHNVIGSIGPVVVEVVCKKDQKLFRPGYEEYASDH